MTSYKLIFAAFAAVMLLAACAKKEEAAAAPEAAVEAAPEAAPMDATPAADANTADGELSGGDKVSDPEPPPAGS